MNAKSREGRERLSAKLKSALRSGTGSLVLAATVLSAKSAPAAHKPDEASLEARAKELRAELTANTPAAARATAADDRLAWWGNWHNWGGWHPYWHNWPNWHNWHNWRNW